MQGYRWMRSGWYAATLYGVGLSVVLGACDPQASPEFRGRSLLTVHGSVTIAENQTNGRLAPALAFVNRRDGQIQILEVGVEGEFPSDFRLDVFAPPSDETFLRLTDFGDDEPRVALGYITAVTADHPDTFSFDSAGGNLAPASSSGINTTQTWCADEKQTNCYTETLVCPTPDTPPEDCDVERSGDPSIKEPMWRFFAGFSQNYVVAYLKDPAPAGSGTAAVLGEPDGFDRGYQLLKVRENDEAIQQQYRDCVTRSEARALERYNDEHDTTFAADQIDVSVCGLGSVGCLPGIPGCESPDKPAVCELPSEEQDALVEELRVGAWRAQLDLGCLVSQFEPVGNAARISIAIARDAAPSFGPNEAAVF